MLLMRRKRLLVLVLAVFATSKRTAERKSTETLVRSRVGYRGYSGRRIAQATAGTIISDGRLQAPSG